MKPMAFLSEKKLDSFIVTGQLVNNLRLVYSRKILASAHLTCLRVLTSIAACSTGAPALKA